MQSLKNLFESFSISFLWPLSIFYTFSFYLGVAQSESGEEIPGQWSEEK